MINLNLKRGTKRLNSRSIWGVIIVILGLLVFVAGWKWFNRDKEIEVINISYQTEQGGIFGRDLVDVIDVGSYSMIDRFETNLADFVIRNWTWADKYGYIARDYSKGPSGELGITWDRLYISDSDTYFHPGSNPIVSPFKPHLFLFEDEGVVKLIDIETKEIKSFPGLAVVNSSQPWLPDGKRFIAATSPTYDWYVVDIESGTKEKIKIPELVSAGEKIVYYPSVSLVRNELLLEVTSGKGYNIALYDLDRGKFKYLLTLPSKPSAGSGYSAPAWSTDGKLISYIDCFTYEGEGIGGQGCSNQLKIIDRYGRPVDSVASLVSRSRESKYLVPCFADKNNLVFMRDGYVFNYNLNTKMKSQIAEAVAFQCTNEK
ncbi:MAG: hypothetical protein QG665_307 [Patescibacteria group bacterium]|nr:hypothetical protein [Patescibacteria group bacterium]